MYDDKSIRKEGIPNVIFIDKTIHESKDEMVDTYLRLLTYCKTSKDFYSLISAMYDEIVEKTGVWIIERQIQDKVRILEELKKTD